MLNEANFRCNFCCKVKVESGPMWTKARFCDPFGEKKTTTNNDLFDLEWTADPMHNVKGAHICNQCASELMDKLIHHR